MTRDSPCCVNQGDQLITNAKCFDKIRTQPTASCNVSLFIFKSNGRIGYFRMVGGRSYLKRCIFIEPENRMISPTVAETGQHVFAYLRSYNKMTSCHYNSDTAKNTGVFSATWFRAYSVPHHVVNTQYNYCVQLKTEKYSSHN